MRKVLIIIGIVLLALIGISVVAGLIVNEPRPEGVQSPRADAMAEQMLQAINHNAWEQTRYLRWTFPGGHHYVWDKAKGLVQVKWESTEVLLRTADVSGKAWRNQQQLKGEAAEEAIQTAWGYFCNDAFWLNAPAKVFDPGTRRRIVQLEEGGEGLLVIYESGGVTPGDAYLWVLGDDGLPAYYRMWVSIVPIGGLKASWEDWITLPTGAKIAATHDLGIMTTSLTNIKGGTALSDIGLEVYPFEALGEREALSRLSVEQ